MFTYFRNRIRASSVSIIILTTIFIILFAAIFPTFADNNSTKNISAGTYLTLDDMQFRGPFTVPGEKAPHTETLTFDKGTFFADKCLEWGFKPAPYWVRKSVQGTHFLAVLESPEHGTMHFEGIYDGSDLVANAFWKKERWYWTIERTYSFKGRPVAALKLQ